MADIGIVGSGIAGLHLALGLQQHGIPATLYAERTPDEQRARRLSNIVGRNGCTRANERRLGVNHWDDPFYDMERLAVCVRGPRPLAFSGRMRLPAQAVDMRIYWAQLLEDFSSRGGRVVIRTFQADELNALSAQHALVVVASGRNSLCRIFPRVAEQSPFAKPQRLIAAGIFRGIAYSEPRALELIANPGHGEILAVPIQSFEPGLTGLGVLAIPGGGLEILGRTRYDDDPRAYVGLALQLLREYAPPVFDRIDPATFDVARPLDVASVAITPTVRRGVAELSEGRCAMAIGDAHVVIDPLTGQGANNASHAAAVLCEAIRGAKRFDRAFCERVERQICSYVVPVSDACNARLQPPEPHFRELLGAAARHQGIADIYADGFAHPDRFWSIASDPERTAALIADFEHFGVGPRSDPKLTQCDNG